MNAIRIDRMLDGVRSVAGRGAVKVRNEQAVLNGRWRVSHIEREGQLVASFLGALRTMSGDTYTLAPPDGAAIRGTFTIAVENQPRTIDLRPTTGEFLDQTLRGIYEVEGDTLRLCLAEPGRERPSEFRSTPGSGRILTIQHRVE